MIGKLNCIWESVVCKFKFFLPFPFALTVYLFLGFFLLGASGSTMRRVYLASSSAPGNDTLTGLCKAHRLLVGSHILSSVKHNVQFPTF